MNAATENAVALWRANHRDAGYLSALLPDEDRRGALAELGLLSDNPGTM